MRFVLPMPLEMESIQSSCCLSLRLTPPPLAHRTVALSTSSMSSSKPFSSSSFIRMSGFGAAACAASTSRMWRISCSA